MNVLVDTSVFSLALRRTHPVEPHAVELSNLLRTGRVALLGIVRQELLSGIPDQRKFVQLRHELRALDDYPVTARHHEVAAESFNVCRSRGVQGTIVDFLMCAVSATDHLPIYTTDRDFETYLKHLPVKLFRSSGSP